MNDKASNQNNLFEEDDFHKPSLNNLKKTYRRKPKNANQLEEWIDDEIDDDILRHIRHI